LLHRGLNQSELARRIGTRIGTVSGIMLGKQIPETETLYAICQELRAYPSWLLLGLGPKYYEDSATELAPVTMPQADRLAAQAPVRALLGVEQWLAEHPELSGDECAWMRVFPWPSPHLRQSDLVYLTAISIYRQARSVQPPPRTPAPPAQDGARSRS
jgi:transcriptional regulator with XRE-family HTH domain